MFRYILFDLDGTLTDPRQGITGCVQYALHEMGIEEPDPDRLEVFIGPQLVESFMEFYGMERRQVDRAVEKYRERFVMLRHGGKDEKQRMGNRRNADRGTASV